MLSEEYKRILSIWIFFFAVYEVWNENSYDTTNIKIIAALSNIRDLNIDKSKGRVILPLGNLSYYRSSKLWFYTYCEYFNTFFIPSKDICKTKLFGVMP